MPTEYTWTLETTQPTTVSSAGLTEYYAYTRALDPVTGEVQFDDKRATWKAGHPTGEKVLRCLRTPKGSAARDPSYGVDYGRLDNARDGAAEIARTEITQALKRYTDRGEIRDLVIQVEVDGTSVIFTISWRDPRDPTHVVVRGLG